jgi:hypothetical protein
MKIAKESIVIAVIGIADLVTTVTWVSYHGAQEANPVFAHYLSMGLGWFALMKLVLLVAPIYLLEWARRRRPKFTLNASRFAIGAYCGLYIIGVAHLNPSMLRPRSAEAAVYPSMSHRRYHRGTDRPGLPQSPGQQKSKAAPLQQAIAANL